MVNVQVYKSSAVIHVYSCAYFSEVTRDMNQSNEQFDGHFKKEIKPHEVERLLVLDEH